MCGLKTETIYELVANQAERSPHAAAVATPGHAPLTYLNLLEIFKLVGTSLHGVGIGRNDAVLVAMPHGAEATVATLSAAAYSTAVPVDPRRSPATTSRLLLDLDVSAVLVPARQPSRVLDAAYKEGTAVIEVECDPEKAAGMICPVTATSDFSSYPIPAQRKDRAVCLPGTPESPDHQSMTHSSIHASGARMVAGLHLTPDDRCLNLVPLWDEAGSIQEVYATLLAGGCVVCPPATSQASDFFDWFDACRPTWFTTDADSQREILEMAGSSCGAIGESGIRFVQSNESDISPDVRAGLERVFNTKVLHRRVEA